MPSQNTSKNMFVTEELTQDKTDRIYEMFTLEDQSNKPTRMQVLLNDVPVDMVLDTGAAVSIISQAMFNRLKQHDATLNLHPSATRLLTYTGEPIPVVGATNMTVQLGEVVATLSAQVVVGEGPDLMGRDWLGRLKVNIGQVNRLEHDKIKEVLDKHEAVFDGNIGCLKDAKVALQANEAAKPKFLKPRTVPYLLREKVEKQLSKMEQQGIISPVQHSQWAAPIVPVPKSFSPSWTCPMPTHSWHCSTSPNNMSPSTPTKGCFNSIVSRSACHQLQPYFKEPWRNCSED